MNEKLLQVTLGLKDKLTPGLKSAAVKGGADLNRLERSAKRSGLSFKQLAVRIAAVVAAIMIMARALRGIINLMKAAIQAAALQELAETKLKTSVDGNTQALLDQASALQQLTGIGDEVIIQGQAMLGTFKLNAQEVELLTPAMLDMAAALQKGTESTIDLQAVSIALGKAATGTAGMLSRYGIVLTDVQAEQLNTAEGMEKIEALTEILNANFEGLAEAAGNTFAGGLNKLKGAWGDLLEVVGAWITKNPVVLAGLQFISDKLVGLTGDLDDSNEAGMNLVAEAFTHIVKGAVWVAKAFVRIKEAVVALLIAFEYVKTGIQLIMLGILSIVKIALEGMGEMIAFWVNSQVDVINLVIAGLNAIQGVNIDPLPPITATGLLGAVEKIIADLDVEIEEADQKLRELAQTFIDIEGEISDLDIFLAEFLAALENAAAAGEDLEGAITAAGGAVDDLADGAGGLIDNLGNIPPLLAVIIASWVLVAEANEKYLDLMLRERDILIEIKEIESARIADKLEQLAIEEAHIRALKEAQRLKDRGVKPGVGAAFEFELDPEMLAAAAIGGMAGGGGIGALQAILPIIGSAFGPIGTAIGGLLGGLLGKKRQRGDSTSNPVFVSDINTQNLMTRLLNITGIRAGNIAGINRITSQIHLQGQAVGAS